MTRRLHPRVIAQIALSLVLAAASARVVYAIFPDHLAVKTSIVGYPTFANFNIDRYIHLYLVGVVFLPLAALIFYDVIHRLDPATRRRRGSRTPFSRAVLDNASAPTPDPGAGAKGVARQDRITRDIGVVRVWFVGLVLGLEVADWVHPARHAFFWLMALAASLAYSLALQLGLPRLRGLPLLRQEDPAQRLAAANALLSPLTVVGLYAVSSATAVAVGTPARIVSYPWFPLWLALALGAGLEAWVLSRLRAGGDASDVREIEFAAVARIAGSVFVFLLAARLLGALGKPDLFGEGENLAGANLFLNHAFPWRDFLFIHGPLQDIVTAALGFGVFSYSRWGAVAGQFIWILPLGWVTYYLANTYLFRRSWPVMLMLPWFVSGPDIGLRFAGIPILTALLAAYLRRRRPWLGVVLGVVLLVTVVMTPELLPIIGVMGIALVAHDAFHRGDTPVLRSFGGTFWVVLGAGVSALAWAGFLLAHHALGAYYQYFLIFAPGHRLTGGIPFSLAGRSLVVAAILPIAATNGLFVYGVIRLRSRLPLAPVDWAMGMLGIFAVYYYTKFLDRADGHVFESFAVALPVVLFVVWKACEAAVEPLRRFAGRRRWGGWVTDRAIAVPVLLAVLAGLTTVAGYGPLRQVRSMAGAFTTTAAQAAMVARMGYVTPGAVDSGMLDDVEQVLNALAGPRGTVFDFSNTPGLFYFLENRPSPTRYYDVAMAEPGFAQSQLDREIGSSRPAVVVYDAPGGLGLPTWDHVPQPVRHYAVSDYLLSHYGPIADIDGFLLLLRDDLSPSASWASGLHLSGQLVTDGLGSLGQQCNWGYVPNFLDVTPTPPEAGAFVAASAHAPSSTFQVTIPTGTARADYHWLEIDAPGGLGTDQFTLSDGSPTGAITFNTLAGQAGTRLLVEVGSCLAWHSYQAPTLTLTSNGPENIAQVKLLRQG